MQPLLPVQNISWLEFWKPSIKVQVPAPPQGHYYFPLTEKCFSATYNKSIQTYPELSQILPDNAFQSAIKSADYVIKTPFFKYTFIRWFLFFTFFYFLLEMILAILSGAVVNIITYAILMILSPIFMRMGGNQYLIRMQKYTKVVRKAMKSQVNTVMAGTGVIIEPGEYCMWLDFYRGSYPDEVPQNAIYFAQPVFYPMPPMPPMPPAQPLV
jgi:hypothetical protein